MNKVWIIKEYSLEFNEMHVVAIFASKESAKLCVKKAKRENGPKYDYEIEEFIVGK